MAAQTIGVRFRDASRIYHFAPPEEEMFIGEYVVVETPRGLEMGHVVIVPDGDGEVPRDVKPIVRLATGEDRDQALAMVEQAEAILREGRQVVQREKLDLYLAGFQVNLEGTEATGFFNAEGHVNFRSLVDALSDSFDLTFHMQHAGPRDRAKIVDGHDICGLRLCCSSWMTEFPKVGIRMAKEQDLALNPDKISGVCGRLLCCLTFEFDVYKEMRGTLPKMGKKVSTPAGMGKVIQVNPLAQQVTIIMDGSYERVRVPAEEIGLAVRIEEAPNQAIVDTPVERPEPTEKRPRRGRGRGRDRDADRDGGQGRSASRGESPAGLRKRDEPDPSPDPAGDASAETAESKPRRRRRRRRGASTEDGTTQAADSTTPTSDAPAPAAESEQDTPRAEQSASPSQGSEAGSGEAAPRRRRRRRRRRSGGGESGSGGDTGGSSPSE
jgi:cell fate regulator YaaT (PSP1 superfamily)